MVACPMSVLRLKQLAKILHARDGYTRPMEPIAKMSRIDDQELRSPLTFTMRHLFAVMVLIAIPLGLLRAYWTGVNDTVDERTIPFSDARLLEKVYLYLALGYLALVGGGVFAWLCTRKNYRLALAMLGMVALCCVLAAPFVKAKIISPVQGNPIAETHNNAASIVAMSVLRYFDRNDKWPDAWEAIDEDISDVLSDLVSAHERRKNNSDPFAHVSAADPNWGEEASQSLSAQAPDVSDITPATLRKLVDVDFTADPKALASQKWYEFNGIIPKKPSYNFYRVEFKKLIGQLSEKSLTAHSRPIETE